ncbi:MAG: hypothetical protein ACI9FR_002067 [Cryomorphaceae bacterium]|jgi:hypothetical protein
MSDPIIELVQLENGDIALRNSDNPDQPLVTICISEQVQNLLPGDRIDVANAMIEAGIERYQEIQFQRMEDEQSDLEQVQSSGLLH